MRVWGFALLAGSVIAMGANRPKPNAGTEILWDTWGVPHIYATEPESLFLAFGWAQAEAHGDLLLKLYGQARGRAAEYWGEDHADLDRWIRTVGVPERSAEWYRRQRPDARRYLEAFAAGINRYASEHPERLADSLEIVLPILPADILAHTQRVVHFTFVTDPSRVSRQIEAANPPGSNAWAIGPDRSASGRSMLLINPHLPWGDLFTWFEAHLVSPGVDVSGAALIGNPFLGVGFNDHLGWTHTVNPADVADLYELTMVDGGYRWRDGVRPFDVRRDSIRIRRTDGTVDTERFEVRSSIHGPVVASVDSTAFALRVAGLDQPHLLEQYWDMARATTLAEFEAAVARLQMPFFNLLYADDKGHILFLYNARLPVRETGDWATWLAPARGDDPGTLWTRTHDYEELPRVLDPPTGWLQNANDPPWTSTRPAALEPTDYPPYTAPLGMAMRPQRSSRMLEQDDRISFEELIEYKHSTRVELADRWLDDLIPLARASERSNLNRAADVLESWDHRVDADSRGAVLFVTFVDEIQRIHGSLGPAFEIPWTPDDPTETPDGLADPAGSIAALRRAAEKVMSEYGSLDVAWGDVHRLIRDSVDLPANGAMDPLGVFRATGYDPVGDGRQAASFGDSYVALVEFGSPLRAVGLLSYGNASRPGSPHRSDQLPLYARQELRPILRSRHAVEGHLESVTTF